MNIRRIFQLFILAAVTLAAASSCGGGGEDFNLAPGTGSGSGSGTESNSTPNLGSIKAIKSRLEMPEMLDGNTFICHRLKLGKDSVINYCVEYDQKLHHSRWVAFRFDKALAERSTGRKDYNEKPQYPKDPDCTSSLPDDASFRGYDHGHLCASADRLCSEEANRQTFYMTNMSPQFKAFNQDYWTAYENYVQNIARRSNFADTLYVVKGGTILPDQRLGTISTSGCTVPVPDHYFIAMLKLKNGTYSAIGLWVEHEEDPRGSGSKEDIRNHAMSIDDLEKKTGINFFHNLPDNIEDVIEASFQTNTWEL